MSTTRALQPAFTSEALSSFERAVAAVLREPRAVCVHSYREVAAARTRLAKQLMRFASSGRSVIQIRQLLSRTLRNEQSSARHRMKCRGSRRSTSSRGETQQRC